MRDKKNTNNVAHGIVQLLANDEANHQWLRKHLTIMAKYLRGSAVALLLLVVGGAGGGYYVYKLGIGFMGFVPKHLGEASYQKLVEEKAHLEMRIVVADAIINDTYSEPLHNTPYSTLSKHQQRRVFEIAFEAGLVNILNWIAGSPEVLNPSRRAVLAQRIDDLNRGVETPFARHDGMYYRQKYYDLKQHHEIDLHPALSEDVGARSTTPEKPLKKEAM
jgi:hypothetical protein